MREPANPFRFRSSENIESHLTFLRLFGLGILDFLPGDCLSNKVTVFRSGPGGGKTSLFRVFRPDSLREVSRNHSGYEDLSKRLSALDVIDDTGPNLLGVYLRLYNYAALQDSESDQRTNHDRLFTLVGVRLIMKALTGILDLKGFDMNQLGRITIQKPQDHCIVDLPLPCNGKELYNWAADMERGICGAVNSFDSLDNTASISCQGMDYLHVLHHKNLFLDGRPVVSRVLIMLDDVHELTKSQRREFLKQIATARLPLSVWIAERLEALDLEDLVGGDGRETNPVSLEEHWAKSKSFERFIKSISDKRTALARTDFEVYLDRHLEDSLNTEERSGKFLDIARTIEERVRYITRDTEIYDKWIDEQSKMEFSNYEKAVGWRALEIRIAKEMADEQKKILDVPLDPESIENRTDLNAAAIFFLHDEFKIPYFFGFQNVSKMATFNVEVFLKIAAELFDEIVSQRLKNKKHEILSAERQEKIITGIAKKHFEQILKIRKSGKYTSKLLLSFRQFAREQTIRPSAPYKPGVTGIGIQKDLYGQLLDSRYGEDREYEELMDVLRSCISHNYLKARYDAQQGKPGNGVVTLYLNRLLCAMFDLPLGKGGWRYKTPDELCKWMQLQTRSNGGSQ